MIADSAFLSPIPVLPSHAVKQPRCVKGFQPTLASSMRANIAASAQAATAPGAGHASADGEKPKILKPMHVWTPLLHSVSLSALAGRDILLKMEANQPSGSFKIRGVGNLCSKAAANGAVHFVCSSGGNAGAAVAHAGQRLGIKTTIVVPSTTPTFMVARLQGSGADVQVHGDVWDRADAYARQLVDEMPDGTAVYVSPFDHPDLWKGHSSIVHELLEDLDGNKPQAIVVSVGGGGLFLGVAEGCRAVGWDDVPIIAAETEGADSFAAMLRAGNRAVSLPAITSIAKSLGALAVSKKCEEWAKDGRPIHSSVVSDREAVQACAALATHQRVLVEPACGAAVAAAVRDSASRFNGSGPIVVVVCGGNIASPQLLAQWMQMTGATEVDLM